MKYEDYVWFKISVEGTINKLSSAVLDKYLLKHGLDTIQER